VRFAILMPTARIALPHNYTQCISKSAQFGKTNPIRHGQSGPSAGRHAGRRMTCGCRRGDGTRCRPVQFSRGRRPKPHEGLRRTMESCQGRGNDGGRDTAAVPRSMSGANVWRRRSASYSHLCASACRPRVNLQRSCRRRKARRRLHGISTSAPLVLRLSSSAWARGASARGNGVGLAATTAPLRSASNNRSLCRRTLSASSV
jgi:hypothetical protein